MAKRENHITKHASHDKKHRLATSDPEVRKLITSLRRDWRKINAVERGQRVLILVNDKDCSVRGLARDLEQSARAVKLAMECANLPDHYRRLIEQGTSPKRVLALAKPKRKLSYTQRILQLANQLAWFVLWQMPEVCRRADYYLGLELFLFRADRRIFQGEPAGCGDLKPGSGEEIGVNRAAELAWPTTWQSPRFYENYLRAFSNFMVLMEAEINSIRSEALKKMGNLLHRLQLRPHEIELVQKKHA